MHATPFHSAFEREWLLPLPVPGVELVSCHFDSDRLTSEDFQRAGIAPVAGRAKRQGEYLAGRMCAREALQRICGLTEVPDRQANGAPRWPEGITGSITHSNGWAAAVAASKEQVASIGIDAESILDPARAQRLKSVILTERELHESRHMDKQDFARHVTLTFSLKESLYKALFPLTDRQFYFKHAEVVELNADGSSRLRLLTELSPEWSEGQLLDGQYACLGNRVLTLVNVPATR